MHSPFVSQAWVQLLVQKPRPVPRQCPYSLSMCFAGPTVFPEIVSNHWTKGPTLSMKR